MNRSQLAAADYEVTERQFHAAADQTAPSCLKIQTIRLMARSVSVHAVLLIGGDALTQRHLKQIDAALTAIRIVVNRYDDSKDAQASLRSQVQRVEELAGAIGTDETHCESVVRQVRFACRTLLAELERPLQKVAAPKPSQILNTNAVAVMNLFDEIKEVLLSWGNREQGGGEERVVLLEKLAKAREAGNIDVFRGVGDPNGAISELQSLLSLAIDQAQRTMCMVSGNYFLGSAVPALRDRVNQVTAKLEYSPKPAMRSVIPVLSSRQLASL